MVDDYDYREINEFCLRPFDRREAMTTKEAADLADRSESTIRTWATVYGIGRRIAGGPFSISRVALAMLLDGNQAALDDYLRGDRTGPRVAPYFERLKQAGVLKRRLPTHVNGAPTST